MILKNYFLLLLIKVLENVKIGYGFRRKFYSTERILIKNYPLGKEISFIQIGANDGKSFDFLYDFLITRNPKGVVIEPIKEYYNELCLNYNDFEKIIKINKAVHESIKKVIVYKVKKDSFEKYPEWVKGIASFDKMHITKFNFIENTDIESETVEADHFMNIVKDCFSDRKVDYIQIDTEGYDYHILKMIDFKNLDISIIKLEFVNLSENEKMKSKTILKENGFYTFVEGIDLIGINLKKVNF
mgnify:CR=1 FL=1